MFIKMLEKNHNHTKHIYIDMLTFRIVVITYYQFGGLKTDTKRELGHMNCCWTQILVCRFDVYVRVVEGFY